MKRGNLVSKTSLSGDMRQPFQAPPPSNPSLSMGEGSRLAGNGSTGSSDVRATVTRRFMKMLRTHDHARMKVLANSSNPDEMVH